MAAGTDRRRSSRSALVTAPNSAFRGSTPTPRAHGPSVAIDAPKLRDLLLAYRDRTGHTQEKIEEITGEWDGGLRLEARLLSDLFNERRPRLTYTKLVSLARLLKTTTEELLLPRGGGGAAVSAGDVPVPTVPPESLASARAARALPAETFLRFVTDILVPLVSHREADGAQPGERLNLLFADVLSGKLPDRPDPSDPAWAQLGARDATRDRRYERNIRQIAMGAFPFLPKDFCEGGIIHQTWLDVFHDIAEKESDQVLQSLWSHLLAGKFINPDGYSIKTLRIVQDLTFKVAEKFRKFCGAVFDIDGDLISIRPERAVSTPSYLSIFDLEFDDLVELQDFGLLHLGVRSHEAEPGTLFYYGGVGFVAKERLQYKVNPLTQAGKELYRCVKPIERQESYFTEIQRLFGSKVEAVACEE